MGLALCHLQILDIIEDTCDTKHSVISKSSISFIANGVAEQRHRPDFYSKRRHHFSWILFFRLSYF